MQRSFFVFLFSCFGVYETNRNVNQMVGASFFTSSIILSKSTSVKLHLFPKNGESFPQISSLLQRFQQGMMLQNISLSFWSLLPEPCVTSLMARGIKFIEACTEKCCHALALFVARGVSRTRCTRRYGAISALNIPECLTARTQVYVYMYTDT